LVAVERALTDSHDADVFIVPVNFVSSESNTDLDVILTALVGVPRRLLLMAHLWGSPAGSIRGFSIQLLEAGKLHDAKPPYLLATPTMLSSSFASRMPFDASSQSHSDSFPPSFSWTPRFKVLVPSFSGRLHAVSLPLGQLNDPVIGNRHSWYSSSGSQTSFAQSSVLTDCTDLGPTNNAVACSLLIDTSSRLLMFRLSPRDRHDLSTQSGVHLLWTYDPQMDPDLIHLHRDQVGQVIVIHCDPRIGAAGQWAVYPTSDGFLHAVNVSTGLTISGYPLRIIGLHAIANVTFSMGPGMIYSTPNAETWLLLSDTAGNLYHVSMCQQKPSVVQTDVHSTDGFRLSDVRIMPAAFVRLEETEAHGRKFTLSRQLLTVFVLSAGGVAIIEPDASRARTSRSDSQLLVPTQDLVYFVDPSTERAVNRLYLESDHRVIHYRIHNCLIWDHYQMNSSHNLDIFDAPTVYIAQVVDAFGAPLSDWSVARTLSKLTSTSDVVCGGSVTVTRPILGSYLLVVDRRTGLIRAPEAGHFSTYQLTATTMLHVETLWPQLVIFWAYMPILYLFVGMAVLWVGQQSQSNWFAKSASRLKFSHSV
uniref:ER membrane protein complex subunit 1 n=1 Tax=Echinostoma caproni TaxID=27848 RepID=A0A183AMM0_9TREM